MNKKPTLLFLAVLVTTGACSKADNKTTETKEIDQSLNNQASLQIARGKELYTRCTSCHSPAYNRTGPKHCGLLGREIGSLPDYEYSDAMIQKKKRWNKNNLNAFIESPSRYIPGTTMQILGISSAEERELLVNYLATLTLDHAKCKQHEPQ